jgi:glycosyltransferase involved in cell wall biosynthesis
MSTSDRLLVVAHDADRGAEQLFLVRLVAALQQQSGADVEVLLWQGGPLVGELEAVAPVRVVDDLNRWWVARLLQLVGLRSVGARLKGLRLRAWMWRAARRSTAVLAHGARAGRPFAYAVRPLPVVVHLTGDGSHWQEDAAAEDWAALLAAGRGFVVSDPAAQRRLVEDHGVADERVRLLTSVVPASLPAEPVLPRRRSLGVPEGAFLLGAAGTEDWWRAPEPIVPIVWALRRRRPDLDVHVLWACYDGDEDGLWPLRHDVRNAGLEDCFHIVASPSSLEHLELCDLVLLATRPDTFRLVGVEVALAAKPVVCFADEVVERALGPASVAVPYLDLDAFVEEVGRLLDHPETRDELGREAVVLAGRAQEAAGDAPERLREAIGELLA